MTLVAGLFTIATLSMTPVDGGTLTFTKEIVNGGAGDQYDPHVDGNLAAYSSLVGSTAAIHYFDFATGLDKEITPTLPDGGSASDDLSDVQGGRIVFTRVMPLDRTAVMLLDVAGGGALSEVNPAAGSKRMGVAVGGNLVAYSDLKINPSLTGDIVAVDTSSNAVFRLSEDTAHDQNPAVAPSGAVVVWEKCTSLTNCDIWQSVKGPTAWTASAVTSSATAEMDPDTSGTRVVYTAQDATTGAWDLWVRPVAGGAAEVVNLAGDDFHPAIAGDLVAFEHFEPGALNADIFLLDLATGRLFNVTSTANVNETLNDVTVLPSGLVRVVWDADDGADGLRNVYAATFQLPGSSGTGGSGGSGGGSGSTCANRSVALDASRVYRPTSSNDGQATFSPAMRFALPSSLPVVAGSAGHGWATLTLTAHGVTTVCRYHGAALSTPPTSPGKAHDPGEGNDADDDDIAHGTLVTNFVFHHCEGAVTTLKPGDIVQVDAVQLHVQTGLNKAGTTAVHLALAEDCGTTAAAFKLERAEPAAGPQAGCSATAGFPVAPLALLVMFALWAQARSSRRRFHSLRVAERPKLRS